MKPAKHLTLAAVAPLAGCGFYPLGDYDQAPSATREQIVGFLETCRISGATIERGRVQAETDWVVAMGNQPREKWDCFNRESERAGVMATAWGQTDDAR